MAKKRSRFLKSILIIGTVAALIVAYRMLEDVGHENAVTISRFTVVKVLDGDTGELAGGDRLRLLSVDTPERDESHYAEARNLFQILAKDKPARLEFVDNRRDRYGRLLAYLYVNDSILVNKALIDSGLGYVYLFKDNDFTRPEVARMIEAQQSAISRKVGIWSIEREPEEFYMTTAGSFRMHRPDCRQIESARPDRITKFQTREEGLSQGLSPCRACRP